MDFASDIKLGSRLRTISGGATSIGLGKGVTVVVTQIITSAKEPFVIGIEGVSEDSKALHCIPAYMSDFFEVLPDKRGIDNQRLERLIGLCTYKDWRILLRFDGDRPYVQIKFTDKDNFGSEEGEQSCRKWMLSYHMCDSEVIRTVKKAIDSAVQHEADENFKYRGRSIYNPHRSIESLWEAASAPGSIDIRD